MWHCVVRAAPGDRMLSDDEWAAAGARHHGPDRARAPRPGRRGGPLDRGPARRGSHPHRRHAGPPGRRAAPVLERLLPGPGGLPGRRGTSRAAAHRARRPDRGPPPHPRGDREGPPPRPARGAPVTLRRAVSTAAAGAASEEEFFARLQEAGVLVRTRYSTREPRPGHRIRRRPGRRHGPRRGPGLVRRREARRRPQPAQAPPPLGRAPRPDRGRAPVHRGGAERGLGARRPHRARRPGADPACAAAGDPARPPTRPGPRRTRCTRRPPRWAAG